jgi:hypothetical protein
MTDLSAQLAVEEYRALRATVRERGSVRVLVSAITFLTWAALLTVVFAQFLPPMAAVISLAALWAGFEVAFALQVGTERVGRYLAVRYENPAAVGGPIWEHAIGTLQRPTRGIHPLFATVFLAAVAINLVSSVALQVFFAPDTTISAELAVVLALHLGVALRVLSAARFAAGQRQGDDLAFREALGRLAGGDRPGQGFQ